MKKKFIIEEPIFKTMTLFMLGYSKEEMGREVKRRGVEDFDVDYFSDTEGTSIFFKDIDYPFRFVWIKYFDKTPDSIGTLSHEILHLVLRICEYKGIPVTTEYNADETVAYLLDFYMRRALEKLFNKKSEW